jgi:hypothetical protein
MLMDWRKWKIEHGKGCVEMESTAALQLNRGFFSPLASLISWADEIYQDNCFLTIELLLSA